MGSGTGRAVLIGGVLGLVCVIAVFAAVATGVFSAAENGTATDGPILVALVLPDADGVRTLRSLELYARKGESMRITSIDPLTEATVPGTSATNLAGAYAFGGGDGLAMAYAESADGVVPTWIAVDPDAWGKLMGSTVVKLRLDNGIDVFDGTRLYSYPAGAVSVPAGEIAQVMNGAEFVDAKERKALREGVGEVLARTLLRERASAKTGIVTNLTPDQSDILFGGVRASPVRVKGAR